MLQVNTVASVTILTQDVVRVNAHRERVIRNAINSPAGQACNAFANVNDAGYTNVELWGGDMVQRQAFKKALETELYH